MGMALFISACGGGNKVDLNDPVSVAKYSCEKQNEVIELIKADVPDEAKIVKISEEMEAFEKDLRNTHGDKMEAFGEKVTTEMKKICPDAELE